MGVMLYSTGCADYDEDIKSINNRIDQLVSGEIQPLKADLAKVKSDLEAAIAAAQADLKNIHDVDIANLKAADAALEAKIALANSAIAKQEAALESEVAALEADIKNLNAAIEAAKKAAADADAATKTELTKMITDLQTALQSKISALEATLTADVDNLEDALEAETEARKAEIEALESALEAAKKAATDADAALKSELLETINDLEAALNQKIADLNKDLVAAEGRLNTSIAALKAETNTKIAAAMDAIDAVEKRADALEAADEEFAADLKEIREDLTALTKKVDDNYAELTQKLSDLESKLQAQIDQNKQDIAANRADINKVLADVADLQVKLEAVNASIAAVNGTLINHINEFARYKVTVDGKIGAIQSQIDQINETIKNVEENLIPGLEAQIAANAELINLNAADIAANAAALESFKKEATQTLKQLLDADEAFRAMINTLFGDVADLKGDVADLYTQISDSEKALAEQINTYYDQLLTKINAVDEKHTENYKTTLDELEAIYASLLEVRNDLAAEAQARVDGDNAINTRIDLLIKKYDEAIKLVNKRVDAVEEALAEHIEAFEAYKKEVAEVIIPEAIAEAVAQANEYTDTKIAELKAQLTDQHKRDITALSDRVNDVRNELFDEIAKVREEMDAMYADLNKAINCLNKSVEEIKADIDAILNRVQSVVYVPVYSDGKATIEWAAIESYTDTQERACTVIEGTSHIDYQVYPAECAAALAEAWNNADEDLKSFLTFDWTGVTVRSEETSFNIVAVKADEEGVLHIDFEARGLADEFYTNGEPGTQGYSISLVIANENANLSSCYTNLVANPDHLSITPGLFYEENGDLVAAPEWIDHSQVDLTIPYTDKSVYKLMEGLELLYIDADGESYKWYELADMGYEVERPDFMYKGAYEPDPDARAYFCYFVALSNGMFEINMPNATVGEESAEGKYLLEASNGNLQLTNDFNFVPRVNLTEEATSESVGSILGATVRYLASGFELNTGMVVKIGKAIGKAEGTAADVKWTYERHAVVDENILKQTDVNMPYSAYDIEVTIDEENSELHDFAGKYNEFIDSAEKATVAEVAEDGTETEVTGVDATLTADAENNVTLDLENLSWDKTYKLTFVYELESIDITVVVMVNTLDRDREKITLKADDVVKLYKDIEFLAEKRAEGDETAPADMVVNVYDSLVVRPDGIYPEADVYNEDVFVTKPAFAETSTITVWGFGSENEDGDATKTIEESWKTNFVFDGGVLEAYVGFSYASFDFAVEKAEYVKTITLWYGQVVELIYDVTFAVPTQYDFKHNDLWVYDTDGYFSQVKPRYRGLTASRYEVWTDTRLLYDFSVEDVDMDTAFDVVDTEAEVVEPLTDEQLAELGITTKFFFVEEPEDANIKFVEGTNAIAYNGKDDSVHVAGKLMMSHSNGASFELPTSFDEGGIYADYIVKKFNPLCDLSINPDAPKKIEVTEAKVYTVKAIDYFDLFESRDGSGTPYVWADGFKVNLIDHETKTWMIGNGKPSSVETSNGWYNTRNREQVYKMTSEFSLGAEIPAQYKNNITWIPEEGIISFDASKNIELTKDVVIPVKLSVDLPWAYTEKTVDITFGPKSKVVEDTPEEIPAEPEE